MADCILTACHARLPGIAGLLRFIAIRILAVVPWLVRSLRVSAMIGASCSRMRGTSLQSRLDRVRSLSAGELMTRLVQHVLVITLILAVHWRETHPRTEAAMWM
jgi:hypothetical protein